MAKQAQRDPNWNNLHPWFKQAYDIGVARGGFVRVGNTTPAFDEWVKYFNRTMSKLPVLMQEAVLKQPGYEVTLPTEWPPGHRLERPHAPPA